MATAVHFFQSVFFDEAYYLAAKTAALNANGSGLRWTVESTLEAIKANNMTPWQHFCDFGCKEYSADGTLGIDPSAYFSVSSYYSQWARRQHTTVDTVVQNMESDPITNFAEKGCSTGITAVPAEYGAVVECASRTALCDALYFNESEYLSNKTAQLNASGSDIQWTVQDTANAIAACGMTAREHFAHFGAFERDANGDLGIDPSHYFDVSRYYADAAKLTDTNIENLANILQHQGLDPITDYALRGYLSLVSPTANDLDAVHVQTTTKSAPLSGDALIDSLIITDWSTWVNLNKVGLSQSNTIYYHFCTDAELAHYNYIDGMAGLNAAQQEAYLDTLAILRSITGVNFAEAGELNGANLLFFSAPQEPVGGSVVLGWTTTNPLGTGSDTMGVILNDPSIVPENNDPRFGNEAFKTVAHELGHAMGLKHCFEKGWYNLNILPDALDNTAWSIMSYTDAQDVGAADWYALGSQYYSPLDILALHYLYGTDGLNGTEGITYEADSWA